MRVFVQIAGLPIPIYFFTGRYTEINISSVDILNALFSAKIHPCSASGHIWIRLNIQFHFLYSIHKYIVLRITLQTYSLINDSLFVYRQESYCLYLP